MPNLDSEQFGRARDGPAVPQGRGGVFEDGHLDLHLNLDINLETINQTNSRVGLTELDMIPKGG